MDIIKSRENSTVKLICLLNSSARQRKKHGMFVCEGLRLCSELARENIEFDTLCVSEDFYEKNTDVFKNLNKLCRKSVVLTNELFGKISDTKSPQGIICICRNDCVKAFEPQKDKKYVALENISDPSNLGTILRTAEALGVDGIIMSGDCCDLFSPKVVRGSMGAIFRMSLIFVDSMADYVLKLNEYGFTTYASVVEPGAQKITDISFESGSVVIIGNEGNGITKLTEKNSLNTFTIPMKGRAESLNAATAAGIIMWELVK